MTRSAAGEAGVRQVLENGSYLLVAYILPRIFTVASVAVAARWLGPERFGAYGTAAALAVMASVVGSLGMLPLLVREIAQRPERAATILASAHRLKVVTGGVMLLTTWIASGAFLADQPDARAATMVLAVGWTIQLFAENLAAYYQAVERMARWTQASALFGATSAAVGIALLLLTGSIAAYCAGFSVGWLLALAWLATGLPPDARRTWRGSRETASLVRALAPFAGAFIGLTIYCKIDVLLIRAWSSVAEVGLYTAAYKAIDVFQALVIVAAGAVYPRLSRAATTPGGSERASRLSAEIILLGAVPVGMTLYLTSAPIVGLLFGQGYAAAVDVLSKLSLLMPMLSLSILGGYLLGAAGRMWPVAGLYAIGVGANVALNAALVPTSGAEGAALARLGSEAIVLTGFLIVLHSRVGTPLRGRVALVTAAGIAVGSLLRTVPDPSDGFLRAGLFLAAVVALYVAGGVLRIGEVVKLAGSLLGARTPETV